MDRDGPRFGILIVLLPLAAVVVASPVGGVAADAPSSPISEASQVDPDSVVLRIHLQPDGSAAWEVKYLIRLDDDNATAAFDSLQGDIRRNRSTFEARFEERMRPTVNAAENATGREMAIRNVTVSTGRQTIGQRYGVITYAFEWSGFAVVEGPRIVAGDAIAGLFLDSETSLRISWPAEYRRLRVEPEPHSAEENAVGWDGRLGFGNDEPLVVVTSEPATTTDRSPSPGAGPDGPPDDGGGLPTALLAVAAVVVLALVGAAGWFYTRGDAAPGGGFDGDGTGEGGERPPEELLSNEERVLRSLEDHGGRMKQQEVASELDWTDAKTSQVVSSLREDGEVESFRLGRENVLTLPGHDLVPEETGEEGNEEG